MLLGVTLCARHAIKPGTPENETTEHRTPAEQQNTPEHWRNNGTLQQNTSGTPPNTNTNRTPTRNTSGPTWNNCKMKNNCSEFRGNLNLALIHLTTALSTGWKYLLLIILFIYYSLFKVGLHVVEKFFN